MQYHEPNFWGKCNWSNEYFRHQCAEMQRDCCKSCGRGERIFSTKLFMPFNHTCVCVGIHNFWWNAKRMSLSKQKGNVKRKQQKGSRLSFVHFNFDCIQWIFRHLNSLRTRSHINSIFISTVTCTTFFFSLLPNWH